MFDLDGKQIDFDVSLKKITLKNKINGYVRYRPILEMMLKNFNFNQKEWDLNNKWIMEFEEI